MTQAASFEATPAPAPGVSGSSPEQSECTHCGLPVPLARDAGGPGPRFCCSACGVAYAIINEAGLGAYYEHRKELESEARRAQSTGRSYAEYDEPSFHELHVAPCAEGERIELFVEGLHCSACVWLVERLPRVVPGVKSARLELGRAALDVVFDPTRVRPSAIARALDGLGYAPHVSSAARGAGQSAHDRALWVRLGVAGAIAGNVMLMALALYSGAAADHEFKALFRWGSFLLSIPSVFYCGSVFLRGGVAAFRTRTPHMDLPISIGILAGFARSAWNTAFGRGEVYFDSITVLIFLLLVGRWLQERHHRGATRALELIAALAPATARRIDDGAPREVPAESVPVGALLLVLPGERIPADGVIVQGRSSIDTAWLTGESLPEDVKPGDRIFAGTENCGAALRLRVEVSGTSTRLGRLLQSVEEAQTRRAPIVRLADRVSGYFVVGALALSLATFLLWSLLDPTRAVDHAVALLVVTCPCALGMATPLAVSTALRRAARAGIFFKGGEFLEVLARRGTLAFDKTGTLTEGKLTLASFVGDPAVKPLIVAAEQRSAHPLGRALVAALGDGSEPRASDVCEQAGAGVVAEVGGHEVRVGSAELVAGAGQRLAAEWELELERQAVLGRPAVAVAVDGCVRAVAAFSDGLRADAASSLEALRSCGYRVAILSGDRPEVVADVAAKLGAVAAARGGMRPEDKLAWVERERRNGPVVMVGDGVNDAAAMAAADVAIAVHGGAEASLVAADAFTTLPGVGKVLEAVLGARRTLGVIRRGIAFSLAYNVVGVGLCMAGRISPLLAAVLMPLSSLTVVTLALRSRTFDSAPAKGPFT